MAYVSWLRSYYLARNAGIAFAILLALAAIVRAAVGMHGFVTVDSSQNVTFDMSQNAIEIDVVLVVALIFGLIFATILAGPLARENAQHLEVVWTKPVSRTAYALEAILACLSGVWAVQIMALIVVLAGGAFFVGPHFSVGSHTAFAAAMAFLGPVAWFAMYLGLTSWLKRGLGAVQGLAWPIALVLPGLTLVGSDPSSAIVFRAFHAVVAALNFVNPMNYVRISSSPDLALLNAQTHEMRIVMLIVLALAYGAVGIWTWNRVEA